MTMDDCKQYEQELGILCVHGNEKKLEYQSISAVLCMGQYR